MHAYQDIKHKLNLRYSKAVELDGAHIIGEASQQIKLVYISIQLETTIHNHKVISSAHSVSLTMIWNFLNVRLAFDGSKGFAILLHNTFVVNLWIVVFE